jgi:Zn-dependent alcohol dehydrogenase
MLLGADGAGIVETIGAGETRFSPGDQVFGQLRAAPFVEAGTDAEYVAVSEDAALARVPDGLDLVVAAGTGAGSAERSQKRAGRRQDRHHLMNARTQKSVGERPEQLCRGLQTGHQAPPGSQ